MAERTPVRRCAIYVRKSSEEGLDMSYNSLEAQRDACAAYVASQRHEGWVKLANVYEDGGYSGGNMVRPGLQQLLADVRDNKVDIILVYKIDRLTRSLTDFARLTETLDKHQVSFVAVTQQFNTSTSMGRLTLNVLLSFAQFEREVAGERIRDKVAASKKKGMWMGGPVPLGYAVMDRKLVIVPGEAETVRRMFERYLKLRSVHLLQQELGQQGVRSRTRLLKDGRRLGGIALGRGAISHMLKNPLYLGLIRHAGELHEGQHEAVIDQDLFDMVQATLTEHGPGETAKSKRASPALLKGLVFDTSGNRLLPTHCVKKGGIQYHYYTSARRLRDAKGDPAGIRVPAGDLDRLVVNAVATRLSDRPSMHRWLSSRVPIIELPRLLNAVAGLADTIADSKTASPTIVRSIIARITVSRTAVRISLSEPGLGQSLGVSGIADEEAATVPQVDGDHGECQIDAQDAATQDGRTAAPLEIEIKSHLLRCGKQVKLVLGPDDAERAQPNPKLVELMLQARRWFADLSSGASSSIADLAKSAGVDRTYISRLITVAFLAPDIVERIVTGDHNATLTPERLRKACPLPERWDDQRALLLS